MEFVSKFLSIFIACQSNTESQEYIMTKLVIKDLAENTDLDRAAMTSIVGGARVRGQVSPAQANPRAQNTTRVVDYPNTLPQSHEAQGSKRSTRSR
jgi:hypothetical protein